MTTPEFPDTRTFLDIPIFSKAAQQLPTVTIVFHILPNDDTRVAIQSLIAAACWWCLGATAANLVRDRRIGLGIHALILALGLATPISSWNTTILSESISISLTALLIATWLRLHLHRTWTRALEVFLVTVAWEAARQSQVLLGGLITLVFIAISLLPKRNLVNAALALAMSGLTVGGFLLINVNSVVESTNLADYVTTRILPNESYTSWYINHGMPHSKQILSYANSPFGNGPSNYPPFVEWASTKGKRVYLEFLLEHPWYTLVDPLPDFSGERPSLAEPALTGSLLAETMPTPTPSMLSPTIDYGRHREVEPDFVSAFLFEQGQIGDLLLVLALAITSFTVCTRRMGWDHRFWIPGLITLSAIPQGYLLSWFGGVGELDRLSIILATSVRIGLWITIAVGLDALISTTPRPHDKPLA
jgi:hypothetical protein